MIYCYVTVTYIHTVKHYNSIQPFTVILHWDVGVPEPIPGYLGDKAVNILNEFKDANLPIMHVYGLEEKTSAMCK